METKFAIGDSHSTFFEQSGLFKSHWVGPLNNATIYQLLKKGLNLFTLKEDLAKSEHYVNVGGAKWQFPNGIYETENVKPGDSVIFCYGFNDVQKNIHKYAADSYEQEINKLITGYLQLIREYETRFQITAIICSIPPNPSPKAGPVGFWGISGDFVANGTSEERHLYNLYANLLLRTMCAEYNLKFLNLYNAISDEDGFLKKEYTTDYIHLQWDNEEVKKIIKELIDNL